MESTYTQKKKKLLDVLTYAYIRKIKRWMFCPACKQGKMRIDKKSTVWTCEDCGYTLSADEFEDDYVFWFCDECDTYLNNQEGFDRKATRHICRQCGYENDTTTDNIIGTCNDCGKAILDPDGTLCDECRQARKEKAKEWLKTAGRVVGVAAAVVGAVCMASQTAGDDNAPIDDYTFYMGFEGEDEIILFLGEFRRYHIWKGYFDDIFGNPSLDGNGWTGFTRDYHQFLGAFSENAGIVEINSSEYLEDLIQYRYGVFDFSETTRVFQLLESVLTKAVYSCIPVKIEYA